MCTKFYDNCSDSILTNVIAIVKAGNTTHVNGSKIKGKLAESIIHIQNMAYLRYNVTQHQMIVNCT